MSRRKSFQGAQEAHIPIEEIMKACAAWSEEIINAVGEEVLLEVKANAAFAFDNKTGNLRKHIRRKKSKFNKDTHIVGAFAPHSHLVEFGHDVKVNKDGAVVGHAESHPFLTPAVEAVRDRLPEIVNDVQGTLFIKVGS